jgi:hypothetical protein
VVGGWIGGRNMGTHKLPQNVTELYARFYTKPKAGYSFGAEKVLTVNKPGMGGGIYWGNLHFNQAAGAASPTGSLSFQGQIGPTVYGNFALGNAGHWYFIELHLKLNSSPGASDGVIEMWVDDCGLDGTSCPATPTLRARVTNYRWAYQIGETIGELWWENWANPASSGERLLDNIKVSRSGPNGFAH